MKRTKEQMKEDLQDIITIFIYMEAVVLAVAGIAFILGGTP